MAVDGRRWQVYGLGLGASEVSGFMYVPVLPISFEIL